MAQFVHQYVAELLKREKALAQAHPEVIATDITYSDPSTYSLNLQILLLLGVVMKKVSEVGGVTDQQWLDALDHAIDASPELPWPAWILNRQQPPPA